MFHWKGGPLRSSVRKFADRETDWKNTFYDRKGKDSKVEFSHNDELCVIGFNNNHTE